MLLEQRRSPLQAKLADYYPVFADMKVGMPQADGSLKLGAQFSPIYIHDLYRVRFAPEAAIPARSVLKRPLAISIAWQSFPNKKSSRRRRYQSRKI